MSFGHKIEIFFTFHTGQTKLPNSIQITVQKVDKYLVSLTAKTNKSKYQIVHIRVKAKLEKHANNWRIPIARSKAMYTIKDQENTKLRYCFE